MNARMLSVLAVASSVGAQQGQVGADVTQSQLIAVHLALVSNSLPLGPVLTPIQAMAATGPASASSSVTPATAASPLRVGCGAGASPGYPPMSMATASLQLDLLVTSPVPGPQWLRAVVDARASGNTGTNGWTLAQVPAGFRWSEFRNALPGYPIYLDVPVDLTAPATFRLTWSTGGSGDFRCYTTCVYYSGGGGGSMDFLVRQEPPIVSEAYGAPCPTSRNTLPIAVAYDPFGVPGHSSVDALLVSSETPFRAAVLCIGASRDHLGPIPLPLDLTPFGAPGCQLLQDLVITVPSTLSASSFASLPLAPPTALRGLGPIYLQWLVVDPSNALGVVASNGVKVEVP